MSLRSLHLRPAGPGDQHAIVTMIRSHPGLNPTGLHWERFTLALVGDRIVGAVQIRRNKDGARELGSLVVAAGWRRQGIATRLIGAALLHLDEQVYMITGRFFAPHYLRLWGFAPVPSADAPRSIRRNYLLGRLAGIVTLVRGRRPKRLVLLCRPAPSLAPRVADIPA